MPVKQHPGWTTKGPGLYTSDECDSEDDGRRQHATDSLPVTATIEKQAKGAFDVFISDSKSGRSTAAPGRSGQVADIADAIESARSTFENFMQMMSKVKTVIEAQAARDSEMHSEELEKKEELREAVLHQERIQQLLKEAVEREKKTKDDLAQEKNKLQSSTAREQQLQKTLERTLTELQSARGRVELKEQLLHETKQQCQKNYDTLQREFFGFKVNLQHANETREGEMETKNKELEMAVQNWEHVKKLLNESLKREKEKDNKLQQKKKQLQSCAAREQKRLKELHRSELELMSARSRERMTDMLFKNAEEQRQKMEEDYDALQREFERFKANLQHTDAVKLRDSQLAVAANELVAAEWRIEELKRENHKQRCDLKQQKWMLIEKEEECTGLKMKLTELKKEKDLQRAVAEYALSIAERRIEHLTGGNFKEEGPVDSKKRQLSVSEKQNIQLHKTQSKLKEGRQPLTTPYSLCLGVGGSKMITMIKPHTALPTRCTRRFLAPILRGRVLFPVYQQYENSLTRGNKLLGTVVLAGVTPAPKGAGFDVTFDVDEKGVLTVTAMERESGIRDSITFTDLMDREDDP